MGLFDFAKEKAAQFAINQVLGDHASVSDLSIDQDKQTITGKVTLAGEKRPITVKVRGWEYGTGKKPSRIRFTSITTSRPLPDDLAALVKEGHWYDVPAKHMGKITALLGE
jgi:hypothetical protein